MESESGDGGRRILECFGIERVYNSESGVSGGERMCHECLRGWGGGE